MDGAAVSDYGLFTASDRFGNLVETVATITRWSWSDWPPLVRGQRVTAWDREWRVTETWKDLSGNETYQLLPAEVVDAGEARGADSDR